MASGKTLTAGRSALFQPFRTVGVVAGRVQAQLQNLGTETFMCMPIDRSFHVYDCSTLRLSAVSGVHDSPITHTFVKKETTLTVTESRQLHVWNRVHRVATYPLPASDSVACGTLFGDVLVLVFASGKLLWFSLKDLVPRQTVGAGDAPSPLPAPRGAVNLPTQPHRPTVVLHPATYLNKVLVGDAGGQWHIVNISTETVLYSSQLGSTPVAITAAAQSPAAHVIAFGCADGTVAVHNIKLDARVTTFTHSHDEAAAAARATGSATVASTGGAPPRVTALAFCTAKSAAAPLLLSATAGGSVGLWDLKKRELFHIDVAAHAGPITTATFLPSQPMFITAGADNALTAWLLDSTDGRPRRLRERSGHAGSITAARFFGGGTVATLVDGADASVAEMVTAGSERGVRVTHTLLAHQCREMSQGNLEKRARELGLSRASPKLRLAPAVAVAVNERFVGDWANVVTAHNGVAAAYAWSWQRKALDPHVLPTPDVAPSVMGSSVPRPNTVTAVDITACGHYALVGGACGTISRFSLQNGAGVGEYPKAPGGAGGNSLRGRKRRRGELLGAQLPRASRDIGKGGSGLGTLHVSGSVLGSLRKVFGAASTLSGPELTPNTRPTAPAPGPADSRLQGGNLAAVKSTAALPPQGSVTASALAHAGPVRGLAVDERNSVVVSGGADGNLRWWSLDRHTLLQTVRVGGPIARMAVHRGAGLLAVVTDDFSVFVYDISSRRRVRSLRGHAAIVLDAAFSRDARWLVTTDAAGHLRVWDVPTGRCVDWMTFPSPATTVNLSPTGEFLVTSHADSPGLSLWLNRSHYGWTPTDTVPTAPVHMDKPMVAAEADDAPAAGAGGEEEGGDGTPPPPTEAPLPPGAQGTMVLSGAPPSHWVNLSSLAAIAERNKPVEPTKNTEAAPFFLPTVGGLKPGFAPAPPTDGSRILTSLKRETEEEGEGEEGPPAAFRRPLTTPLSQHLAAAWAALTGPPADPEEGEEEEEPLLDEEEEAPALAPAALAPFRALAAHLLAAPPSAVDADLRSLCLGAEDAQGQEHLTSLLRFFAWQLRHLQHYELVQAQASLVLQEFAPLVAAAVAATEGTAPPPAKVPRGGAAAGPTPLQEALAAAACDLLVVQQRAEARVTDLQTQARSLVAFLSNMA